MSKARVAVLRTSPATVVEDYHRLMHAADYQRFLPPENTTIVKLNLSWTLFYPACSSAPWQLEGVLSTLRDDGYKDIVAAENQTVVTHPWKGAYYNKWLPILHRFGVKFEPLTNVEWVPYRPKAELLAMHDVFDEILVPKLFLGSNMIHLPTVKTHGHTTTTGAVKDAFGGLIPKYRHHAHRRIHEVLVDLLSIQKEIHPGLFAVMDGCVCGSGAGPRTMEPFIGNIILASDDQVAIDAVAARVMGFVPQGIDYIRLADEKGLGAGQLDRIDLVGMERRDVEALNFGFEVRKSPVITWDQILREKTAGIGWLHNLLFHSPVFRAFIFASEFYHDRLWYPSIGKRRLRQFLKTDWGKLFASYKHGEFPRYEDVKDWDAY